MLTNQHLKSVVPINSVVLKLDEGILLGTSLESMIHRIRAQAKQWTHKTHINSQCGRSNWRTARAILAATPRRRVSDIFITGLEAVNHHAPV